MLGDAAMMGDGFFWTATGEFELPISMLLSFVC